MARKMPSVDTRPAPPLRPDFEFCIPGPPVSAQAKNRDRLHEWQARVAAAAKSAWPDDAPPITGDLEVMISEFSEFRTRDRDNVAKPILDAMQGVVYRDDRQLASVHIEWCDINGAYVVRNMSPVVAAALSVGGEFLWIRVSAHRPRRDLRQ